MKKFILPILLFISITSGFAQVSVTPKFGCPNTNHDVTISVTNNVATLPASFATYTIDIRIKTAAPASDTIGSFVHTGYTDGFTINTSKNFVVPNVAFQGAMTCDVAVRIIVTSPIGANYPYSATYVVQTPPTLTISESPAGTLTVPTLPDAAYSIRYYKDANYAANVDQSTTGVFTPTVSGSYTAKAFEPTSACSSAVASNAIAITVLSTDVKEGQNVNVSVYPNPMASSVTISTALANSLTYELSDMTGAIVRAAEFTTVTNVNVESLKAGNYVLTVKDKNAKVASYKLVK